MSRGKRRSTAVDRLVWYDQDGKRYEESRRMPTPMSLGAIPRESRLVDVHCPADHFIAALVRNVGKKFPLLYTPSVGGPAPTFVLVSDQLAAAFVSTDPVDGHPMVTPVGTPRDSFPVWCEECRREFDVSGTELQAKLPTQPTRHVPRVHVD